MSKQRRIQDYGIQIGRMEKGPLNKITDVPGVRVGHCTLDTEQFKTGVTVILPGPENPFLHKPVAASYVLNGYGKSLGLVQVEELGTLETPIALTGTLNVGRVHDAMVQVMLDRCRAEGRPFTSINPVILECNDGRLSNIAERPAGLCELRAAMDAACEDFDEGSVGAGRGMICHGLKGGIGSASRVIALDGGRYTLGALALTNHGGMDDLTVAGRVIGPKIREKLRAEQEPERGSVIIVVATDLPVDDRQLRRILRRTPVGLARLGSYVGHGSGEVMVGFTTANRMPMETGGSLIPRQVLREDLLDHAFRAAAECVEEAALNAMICADTTKGYRGDTVFSLKHVFEENF